MFAAIDGQMTEAGFSLQPSPQPVDFLFYFLEVYLIYNVALISPAQQSDSVVLIYIHFHILSC